MVRTVIKVTVGGCGIKYKDGNGVERHALKTPEDGPFECEIEQAKRLVALGVAEYASPMTIPVEDAAQSGDATQAEPVTGHLDAEQLEGMTNKALKALAEEMGLDVSKCTKKAEYIAAITAAEVEADDEDEDNDLPNLSAADPE